MISRTFPLRGLSPDNTMNMLEQQIQEYMEYINEHNPSAVNNPDIDFIVNQAIEKLTGIRDNLEEIQSLMDHVGEATLPDPLELSWQVNSSCVF